jgi:O-antigen ligase
MGNAGMGNGRRRGLVIDCGPTSQRHWFNLIRLGWRVATVDADECLLFVQYVALCVLIFMAPISKAAIEVCFPIMLACWLWRHIVRRKPSVWLQRPLRLLTVLLAAHIAFCLLSVFFSTNVSLSLRGFFRKSLEYYLMFIIAADTITTTERAKRLLQIMLCSVFFVCFDGLFQEVVGFDLFRGHPIAKFSRMTGPFENPNDLGIYLIILFPHSLGYFSGATGRTRIAAGAVLLLAVGCLTRTMYVTGFLASFLGLILFAYTHHPSRKWVTVLAGIMLICAGALQTWQGLQWKNYFVRFDETGHATGLQDRLWMWGAGWGMLQENPITGVGLNTFMDNYLSYHVGGEAMPRYAHNCYLQMAAETGWPGAISWMLIFIGMLRLWLSAIPKIPEPKLRLLAAGLAIGLFDFMVHSFLDTNFYAIRHAALFWSTAGLLCGLSALKLTPTAPEKPE